MRVQADEELRAALRREADRITPNPAFARQALDAAKRGRRVRRRWIGAGVAGFAAATAGALAAVVVLGPAEPAGPGARESAPVDDACPVGEVRPAYPGFPGKSESVLLGCAQLRDGRQVELLNQIGGCLQIRGIDDGLRECGNAPSEQDPPQTGKPVAAQMIAQRSDSAPLEVYGATSADVTMVELTYTDNGVSKKTFAELIRVTDDEVLEKAGIAVPFGYFLDELPPNVSNVNAVALDADGQRLGADSFEPYLQSQPRTAPISGPSRQRSSAGAG